MKRNVVPIMTDDFSFDANQEVMTGRLAELAKYNGITLSAEFFDAGMKKLRERFLNSAMKGRAVPISLEDQNIVDHKIATAQKLVAATPEPTVSRKVDVSARSHLVHGHQLRNDGDLDNAIVEYTEAIRLDPDHAATYYARGDLYYQTGEFEAAIEDYSTVATTTPFDAGAFYFRALALEHIGDFDAATADYETALSIDSNYPMAQANLETLKRRLRKSRMHSK